MTKRRTRKKPSLTITPEGFEKIAAIASPGHAGYIERGFSATGKFHKRKDGTWTARFVYRSADRSLVVTHVVPGLELPW